MSNAEPLLDMLGNPVPARLPFWRRRWCWLTTRHRRPVMGGPCRCRSFYTFRILP